MASPSSLHKNEPSLLSQIVGISEQLSADDLKKLLTQAKRLFAVKKAKELEARLPNGTGMTEQEIDAYLKDLENDH
ncbi:MAG: hypothetical protein K2X48_11910 [Chitinophagaceae bacterium]|nr:hypothetical protein [Chitinophagaceae bacterium]